MVSLGLALAAPVRPAPPLPRPISCACASQLSQRPPRQPAARGGSDCASGTADPGRGRRCSGFGGSGEPGTAAEGMRPGLRAQGLAWGPEEAVPWVTCSRR